MGIFLGDFTLAVRFWSTRSLPWPSGTDPLFAVSLSRQRIPGASQARALEVFQRHGRFKRPLVSLIRHGAVPDGEAKLGERVLLQVGERFLLQVLDGFFKLIVRYDASLLLLSSAVLLVAVEKMFASRSEKTKKTKRNLSSVILRPFFLAMTQLKRTTCENSECCQFRVLQLDLCNQLLVFLLLRDAGRHGSL